MPSRSDYAWAWIGAVAAAGVSIGINVGHATLERPWYAAYSATLPLMSLIAAEQAARRLLGRWTLPLMVGVGVSAYAQSFWHAVLQLAAWGEPRPLQFLGAFAVDVLAVSSAIALYRASRRRLDAVLAPDAPGVQASTPSVPLVDLDAPDGRAVLEEAFRRTFPTTRPLGPTLVGVGAFPSGRTFSASGANGHDRRPDAVQVEPPATPDAADRPQAARVHQDPDGAEEAVWAEYDRRAATGRPMTWSDLGNRLGITADAARKRAGRRS